MAYTLNRRLAELIDSSGQLNTGKIPNAYISTAHIANNVITSSMLHTGFTVSASNLSSIDTDDVSEGSSNLYYTNTRVDSRLASFGNNSIGTTGTISSGAITATSLTIDSRLIIDGSKIYDNSTNGNSKGFRIGGGGLVPLNGSGTDTTNLVDIGANSVKFKDLYLSGTISSGAITSSGALSVENGKLTITEYTGSDAYTQIKKTNAGSNLAIVSQESLYMLLDANNDQTNRSFQVKRNTDSPAGGDVLFLVEESGNSTVYGNLSVTGDLNITGDINSVSVTDLDVTDKTITVGVGGSSSANDGAGIVVAGANASLTWDFSNSRLAINTPLKVGGTLEVDDTLVIKHTGVTTGVSTTDANNIQIGSYLRLAHTSYINTPVISVNAKLTASDYASYSGSASGGGTANVNTYTPDYNSGGFVVEQHDAGGTFAISTGAWGGASSLDNIGPIDSGTYRRLQIKPTGDILFVEGGGNVGVGIVPTEKLHVGGVTKIESSTSNLLVLNPTSNNHGGILHQYNGVTKGISMFNSNFMVFGGESGTNTVLQSGGQYGLFIDNSTRNVSIGAGLTAGQRKLTVVGAADTAADNSGILQLSVGTGINTDSKMLFGIDSSHRGYIHVVKPGNNVMNLILNPTGSSNGTVQVYGPGNTTGGNLKLGGHGANGVDRWSLLTGTHYNDSSQHKGVMLIGSFSNSTSNVVAIGGNVYEANPATQIEFWTHTATTHSQGGSRQVVINNTNVDIINNGLYMASTLLVDTNRNISAATGAFSGKVAVMSSSVHGSYDLYNNGTTYLNGSTTVDDNLYTLTAGVGVQSPSRNQHGSVDPKLHVRGNMSASGSYPLVARFEAGQDADNTGCSVLFNHSNDRGLLIEAGRQTGDRGIVHFGVLNSAATNTRVLTLVQQSGTSYCAGVNVQNPSQPLAVSLPTGFGDGSAGEVARFTNNSTGATSGYLYLGASSGTDYRIGKNIAGTAGNTNFGIGNHVGTEYFNINGSGNAQFNVGYKLNVGTASTHTVNLQVGNQRSDTVLPDNGTFKSFAYTNGDGLVIGHYDSAGGYGTYLQAGYLLNSHSPAFNGGYPIVLNPKGGKVGIGLGDSDQPDELLHLRSSQPVITLETAANSGDPGINMKSTGAISSEGFQMWYVNNVGDVHFATTYNDAAASIRFHTGTGADRGTNNERFVIGADGVNYSMTHLDMSAGTFRMRSDVALDHDGSSLYIKAPASIYFYPQNTNRGNMAPNGTLTVVALTESSSIRYKENVKPITNGLEVINKFEPVTYDRTDNDSKNEPGFIAEEVLKFLPNVINHNEDGEVESIKYTKIIAYLVDAVQELSAEVEKLKNG